MPADFSRNLGLLTDEQQSRLSAASVAICGVGGMGGIAAEALCRMGVGSLVILDHDRYDASNVNRQIHCTQAAFGRLKIDVVAEKLRAINPGLKLSTFPGLTAETAPLVVNGVDIVINGMDDIRASLLLERTARAAGRTIVDAWITPYASVFVMTPKAPHWEDFLRLPTRGKPLEQISDEDVRECLRREVAFTLSQFNPYGIIEPAIVEGVLAGKLARPSLVPVVWMSGTLMANEAMKILTGQGRIASHWGVFYNQYDHEIRYLDGSGEERREEGQPARQLLAG